MLNSAKNPQVYCAIIAGSGFDQLSGFTPIAVPVITPYGIVRGICAGEISGQRVYFLARHCVSVSSVNNVVDSLGRLAPHKINYRAQMWALKSLGVDRVFAVNAAGSIDVSMQPGDLCIPSQIIDYTYGREHTYFDGELLEWHQLAGLDKSYFQAGVHHIDFTKPFCANLRQVLINACAEKLDSCDAESQVGYCHPQGTYGCTQGPRLETAAEIQRLRRDGCDLVGMTAMPESALAKELGISYVSICALVNYAAGIEDDIPSIEVIMATLETAIARIKVCISTAITSINTQNSQI